MSGQAGRAANGVPLDAQARAIHQLRHQPDYAAHLPQDAFHLLAREDHRYPVTPLHPLESRHFAQWLLQHGIVEKDQGVESLGLRGRRKMPLTRQMVQEGLQLTVTDTNGNVVVTQLPPPRTVRLANLAFSDGGVAKALRLIAQPDSGSWVGLYRLYELVEADVGDATFLIRRGWTTARTLKEFKHSANSIAVAGDAARHGKETGAPPRNPMSLAEAAAYVTYILEAWLAYKGT